MHSSPSVLIDVTNKTGALEDDGVVPPVPIDLDPTSSSLLHQAARKYDAGQMKVLLESGSDPNVKDHAGRTVVHVLLGNEFLGHINETAMLNCLKLLTQNKCNINEKDPNGESPLSLSVFHGFESCAHYLVKSGADTSIRSPKFKRNHSLATTVAATMPKVMDEILNTGVTLEYTDNAIPVVRLDWRPVLQYSERKTNNLQKGLLKNKNKYKQRETSFLYSLLDLPLDLRYRYLTHPLVSAFLYLKRRVVSRRLQWFHYLLSIFPILYMIFIYVLYFNRCKLNRDSNGDGAKASTTPNSDLHLTSRSSGDDGGCEITVEISIVSFLLMAFVVLYGVFEVYMLLRVDTRYMRSWRTWVIRASIVIMAFTLWPGLQFNTLYNISWQYPIAAMGTFLAWVMFLIQMELVPQVKVYLEMLVAVILSVLKISVLFLPLLMGFFMGFNLIYADIGGIMSFILMTVDVGSQVYDDMVANTKDESMWFTVYADLFSLTFIVIIAIVFMNFLLGASISDIQELKRNAKIMSLSNRIQNLFITDLLFSSRYYVVSKKDWNEKRWYYKFQPSSSSKDFPKKTRNGLYSLLKTTAVGVNHDKNDASPLVNNYGIQSSYDKLVSRLDRLEGRLNSIKDDIEDD